ncbi:hypothetical protein AB5J62_35165 [Amycolatopsis sp. cg5]|uniref:hypothetical protein n=1 Tax=Amycolatopsis sp. cg5 TaxID=3238802 RepID=UPI003525FEE3
MAKPSTLQVRNAAVALVAAGIAVWNLVIGGPFLVTLFLGLGCVLAIASAYLNRPGA